MSKTKCNAATHWLIYVGLIGNLALVLGVGIGQVIAGSPRPEPSTRITVLDQRIASAREIKEALGKPLPQVELLQSISSKLANYNVVKARQDPKGNALSVEALNAIAMGTPRTVAERWCFTNPASCQSPTAAKRQ